MAAGTGSASFADDDATFSPEEETDAIKTARRLWKAIVARSEDIERYRRYRNGDHPLRYATRMWRQAFGGEFGDPTVDNWCKLVVDAGTERMSVQGFRVGRDQRADDQAGTIWKRSGLHLRSDICHTDSANTGYSYLLVWEDDDSRPLITVEDPLQAIVEYDAENPLIRANGLKCWRERATKQWHALLFTPDTIYTLTAGTGTSPARWRVESAEDNDYGVVPLIEVVHDPDVYNRGHSVIEPVCPLNDMVNKLLADMQVASEFAAYPQRVLLNVEVPIDPRTGKPDRSIVGGIQRWIVLEGGGGDGAEDRALRPDIKELRAADLSNYTKPLEFLINQMASMSRTPPHYLLGTLVNISGDALRAAETGLVSRVRRAMKFTGAAWEEAMRIAFLIEGDERATGDIEIIWGNPETTSEAQRADALVKLKELGVPVEALWPHVPGTTQKERDRWPEMAERQARREGLGLGSSPNGAPVEPDGDAPPTAAAA